MTEADQRRAAFEALSEGARNKKIGIAISAASGAYTGFTIGGPVGAAIGGALGVLTGLWGLKSYRARVYAELEAAGMVSRPRLRSRSLWDRYTSDTPGFFRYPHSELVGDAVIQVLTDQYPGMAQQEINDAAYTVVKTFDQFRRDNPDVPIEIVAEVILLMNGIRRNPQTGNYERFQLEFPSVTTPAETFRPPQPQSEVERSLLIPLGFIAIVALIMLGGGK